MLPNTVIPMAGGGFLVSNDVTDKLNAVLDAAIAELPEAERAIAQKERPFLYSELLRGAHSLGGIPDSVSLTKKGEAKLPLSAIELDPVEGAKP